VKGAGVLVSCTQGVLPPIMQPLVAILTALTASCKIYLFLFSKSDFAIISSNHQPSSPRVFVLLTSSAVLILLLCTFYS